MVEIANEDAIERSVRTSKVPIESVPEPVATEASRPVSVAVEETNRPRRYPPAPTIAECLAFVLPALGIYTCPPLMSLIDTTFVGRFCDSVDLAALGPASTISDMGSLPLIFVSVACTNLVSRAYAERDDDELSRVTRTALAVGLAGGALVGAALFLGAGPVSSAYCASATSLVPACRRYVAARAIALPAVVVAAIAQAVCVGTRDTRTPMMSVALAGGANLLGDFFLVAGLGMGVTGAAYATSASQILAAALLVRQVRDRGFLSAPRDENGARDERFSWSTARRISSFLPFMYVTGVKVFWHSACVATAASLQGAQAAAHTALLAVSMLGMNFGDVGSSLSQAFLPPFASGGEGTETKDGDDDASTTPSSSTVKFDMDAAMPTFRQLLKCTLGTSTLVVTLASLIIGVFGGQITNDPAVLKEMRRTLPWLAATLCFHGSAVTLEGLLLASAKFKRLSSWYTILAVAVAGWQVVVRRWNLGLAGVWGCYLWFCASRVVAFSWMGGLLKPKRWWRRTKHKPTTLDSVINTNTGEPKIAVDPPPL